MQNTTADYKIEIDKPSRQFECKITIGNNIYTNEDLVNLTLEYTQPQEGFSIGNTISQSLDLILLNKGDIIYSTSQIKVEIGLKIGSTIEYILMGIFNIDDIEKTDYTTKFTAYDNMIKFETTYFSSLGDKPTLQQVVNELASKTGVEFTGSLPSYTVSKLEGFSCREVLSYVASICGGNAFITRDGKFTIKSLSEVEKSIDGSNYFEYKREEVKYKVGQISCQVDENNILSKGSIGTDSMELGFENPWVTETILTEIYNKLNGLSYLGYSMKWQGDISLDPYDIITVTDVKNVVRKIPILSQKLTYTGGLTSEIGAKGETKNKNSFSSSGSTTNKVNRLVTEQAIIKEALIDKANIKDLEVSNAKIESLEAKTAKIEEAIIDVAYVSDLTAINANIQTLFANDATINNALINKANITDLTATNIKFNVASGGTLDLQTLLAKHITGENGQFINISSSNTVIANATIKNAMIESISVDKLLAGRISTTKFTIVSDNGGIEIVGATQQFKDKNNKVRIQMGQDTQGNFNFILRGEDGTTTLIDHTGIKEKAIADDLIKSNMVAEDAIGEKQINYSSLITGLNKDTNTSLIKASKVAIDLTGQSLEVSFNSLKSNVDGIEVGGRNLIKLSSIQNYIGGNLGNNTYYSIEDSKIIAKNQARNYLPGFKIYIDEKFEYTVSGHTDLATVKVYFRCYDSSNLIVQSQKSFSINVINGYFKETFNNIPTNTHYINIGIGDDTISNYYIDKLKLEKGNKVTDWTPAPEDVDSKIESNTTAITVAQGKIEGLISENTIIKGDITTISDKYTSLKATVDGINTTVASHTSSIGTISTDLDTVNALADSKAKIFTSTPTTPYKIGDLWVQGTSGEIMKCKTARASGSYVSSDWEKASKYTDDTKANTVEGNLNTLSGKVTIVENNYTSLSQDLSGFKTTVGNIYSTKSELSTVDGKVTSLNSRVSTAESSITQLNNKIALKIEATDVSEAINNIQIGGRNLAPLVSIKDYAGGSLSNNKYYSISGTKITATNQPLSSSLIGFKVYTENTFVFTFSGYTNLSTVSIFFRCYDSSDTIIQAQVSANTTVNNGKFTLTFSAIPSNTYYFNIGIGSTSVSNYYIDKLKLEKGNKATDYTPAPEDVDSAISTVDNKVNITNNKVAEIVTSLDGINLKVQSTEQTVSSHTTKLGQVDTKISNAKTGAINSASSDATNKANSALNSAKEYINGQITTVNQTITDKVAEIKLTTDSITQRVSSSESTISSHSAQLGQVDSKISTAKIEAIQGARTIEDTRNTNETPQWYMSNYANQVITEFKFSDVIGISSNVMYGTLETKIPWPDKSGGLPTQTFRNNGIGTSYERVATSTTTWGAWRIVEDTEGSQNKANTAQLNANNYTNGQITIVNQIITDKVAEIKLTTDSITQRVSSTEINITTVNTKVDNIKIGGRNLLVLNEFKTYYGGALKDTSYYSIEKYKIIATNQPGSGPLPGFKIYTDGNSEYTLSGYTSLSTVNVYFRCHDKEDTIVQQQSGLNIDVINGYFKATFKNIPSNTYYFNIGIGSVSVSNYYLNLVKLEKGNKATDFTEAPEDIDNSIENVQTQINTTNNKVASVETNLSSITSRVSSTESSIKTINGNVSSLQSRMSSAEQKITDSSIISTVTSSSKYTTDLNSKANQSSLNTTNSNLSSLTSRVSTAESKLTATSLTTTISSAISGGASSISTTEFVMDKNGLTIKNGSLTIKNNVGTTVLTSDTYGNLKLAGSITSSATITGGVLKSLNEKLYFDLNNGNINIYDGTSKTVQIGYNSWSGTSYTGATIAGEYNNYACLGNKTSASTSTYTMMLTTVGQDMNTLKKGVNLGYTLNTRNWDIEMGSSTYLNWRQDGAYYDSFITEGSEGMLRMYGDNGVYLGYREAATNYYIIAIRESGNHTYPKALSIFDDNPATDINGYSLEVNAPLRMMGQSIEECSNIKTLGIEIVEPIAFYNNETDEVQTRTLKVTKSTQDIVEFIGSATIVNGEAIIDLPNDTVFKNYVVLLSSVGLDRKVALVEKNDDNFKIVGDDGVVDYVIKFESVSYSKYMNKSFNDLNNTDVIERSEKDKPVEILTLGA